VCTYGVIEYRGRSAALKKYRKGLRKRKEGKQHDEATARVEEGEAKRASPVYGALLAQRGPGA
jgi:hypothetical protein